MTIENTSDREPLIHLLGSTGEGGMSAYVEGMEAQGQREVVASQSLPVDADWDALAQLGIRQVGEPRDLFVDVTVPDGWTREGSDHAMWSYLCDERGVQRVSIFYKAAFYDRRASATVQNVGRNAAGDSIYGDDPIPLPAKWDVFTDAERADYVAALRGYIENAIADEISRKVYGERVPRVEAALELVGQS